MLVNENLKISFEDNIIRLFYETNRINKGIVIKKELTEESIKGLLLFGSRAYLDGIISENNFKISETVFLVSGSPPLIITDIKENIVFVKWLNDEGTYEIADFDFRCLKYE